MKKKTYKEPVPTEGQCILNALTAIGEDYDLAGGLESGVGVYNFLGTTPLSLLCDIVAKKLNEQGYRVTKLYKKRKSGENFL